jgi:hypothetical protein
MSDEAPKTPKRPYVSPRLVSYGDVRVLTQTNPTGQKADRGGAQKNRTS